ncbi:MAG: T9SS type A sorting domain-containing protein, partial [Bacteroidota bacterium]
TVPVAMWNPLDFTTIDNFSLQLPANNATKVFLNAPLTWKAVNGLLVYGYQIATDAAFTHMVIESELDTIAVKSGSFRVKSVEASFLKFGTQYYWRVRGRHNSDTAIWTTPYSFTTINTVDLKTPTNGQTNVALKPTLTWTKQTGIVNYEIVIGDSLFTSIFLTYKANVADGQYIVGKTMLSDKKYFWKMRSISDDDTSNWSPSWSFRTTSGTGFAENSYGTFSVYPNPTSGKIFVKIESKENQHVTFEVIDLLGKTIQQEQINLNAGLNVNEIVLQNVNKGIYLVRLNMNGSYINQKIIVEK